MKITSVKPRVAMLGSGKASGKVQMLEANSAGDRQAKRALHTGSKAWRIIRLRILLRDLYTCKAPGCGMDGNEIDHINGDSADNRDVNLQTLCKSCHSKKTAKENHGFGND